MIGIIATLLYFPELDNNPNPTREDKAKYEILSYDREGLTQLGRLTTTTCRTEMTTTASCPSYEVAKFKSLDSDSEFTICFESNEAFNGILRADQDIRLAHFNGYFYVLGEPTYAYGNRVSSNGPLASALIKITDCNPQ